MFEVYSLMYGRNFVPVHYTDDLDMPASNIIEKLDASVQLLILLNPNNPVGNAYTDDEMAQIMAAAEANEITVLIDEAYHYFYPKTFMDYALNRENVFVTRTFSKLFSLAGCRLGYVAGWPEGIALVQKLCTPHNVNAFAMRFAQAILDDPAMEQKLVDDFVDGKAYLEGALDANGYEYHTSCGNFMFIKPKTDADALVARMKQDAGILIKSYAGIGALGNCLRVTTGARQYMERFIEALLELDK